MLGADTKKQRTKDSVTLIEYAFSNYQMIDMGYMLHEKFDTIVENTEFEVVKGIDSAVRLDLQNNNIGLYPVNKNDVKDIKCEATIKTTLEAPVQVQDKLRRNYNINWRRSNI